MRWNASLAAALGLLLAGCGGGTNYNYRAQAIGAPGGLPAAQAFGAPALDQQDTETWRAADGTLRSRHPAPAKDAPRIEAEPVPDGAVSAPAPRAAVPPRDSSPQMAGTSYPVPGAGRATRSIDRAPAPQAAPQRVPDYPDPTAGSEGPRGSSRQEPGEQRYDEVGYAGVRGVAGGGSADDAVVAVHRSVAVGSYVEVTELDAGRTILVFVTGSMNPDADHPIDLSAGAARLLGHEPGQSFAVRIRSVAASPQDKALLRAGGAAGPRPDAPPILVSALRKRIVVPPVALPVVRPPRASSVPTSAAPRNAAPGRFIVQIAALSNAGRAQALAQSMGGFVKQGGGLHRVQLGPFANQREADAARVRAARAGYGDARVLAVN